MLHKLRVNIFDLAMSIAKVVDLMNAAVGKHHAQVAYWAYRLADVLALPDDEKYDIFLIDFKSEFTATHSSGVAAVAVELARVTGFSKNECWMIEIAGYLHDLGKLAIPSEIIQKAGRLNENERFIMRSHVYHTYQTLEPFEALQPVSRWGSLHQERLNGTGYPFGLDADGLPLGARIMAVADVFTALTEDRPYREGMDSRRAMAVLRSMSDKNELDATMVARIIENYDRMNVIREAAQSQAMREYTAFHKVLESMTAPNRLDKQA